MSYQQWEGYPDSPVSTEEYPYQVVVEQNAGEIYFVASNKPLYYEDTATWDYLKCAEFCNRAVSTLIDGVWNEASLGTQTANINILALKSIKEANSNVFVDNTLTTVYFARTTLTPTSILTMEFSKNMADPAGKHTQFAVTRDEPSDYQQWEGYPQSPISSAIRPYQCIISKDGVVKLLISMIAKGFAVWGQLTPTIELIAVYDNGYTGIDAYDLENGVWVQKAFVPSGINNGVTIIQSNHDIMTPSHYTTLFFAKTTPSINVAPNPLTPSPSSSTKMPQTCIRSGKVILIVHFYPLIDHIK